MEGFVTTEVIAGTTDSAGNLTISTSIMGENDIPFGVKAADLVGTLIWSEGIKSWRVHLAYTSGAAFAEQTIGYGALYIYFHKV